MPDGFIDHRSDPLAKGLSPLIFIPVAIGLLICLRWPLALAPFAGAAALFVLLWFANYTRHHIKWLVLALLLNEMFASLNLLSDSVRPFVHYSLLALFCIPLVPKVLRTGLLKQGGFRLYLLYFLWGAITIIYSIYPVYSLARVLTAAVALTATVAVIAETKDESDICDVIGIFWIGCAITIAVLAFSLVLPSDLTWAPDENGIVRFAGFFNNPNQIGELALTTVASGMIYWQAASRRTRVLIAGSITLAMAFDAMADSRSSFVALGAGLSLLAITRFRFRAVVGACVLAITVLFLFGHLGGGRDYLTRGDVSSLTGRTDVWKYAVHAIKQRPLLGYGYEVEGQIFQNRDFPLWEEIWTEGPRSSIHNGYLSRVVGVGIPAALLWAFIMVRALSFAALKRQAPVVLRNAVLIGAIPILILNMSESTAGDCRYSVGLLLTLVWAMSERWRLSHAASTAVNPGLHQFARQSFPIPGSAGQLKPRLEGVPI